MTKPSVSDLEETSEGICAVATALRDPSGEMRQSRFQLLHFVLRSNARSCPARRAEAPWRTPYTCGRCQAAPRSAGRRRGLSPGQPRRRRCTHAAGGSRRSTRCGHSRPRTIDGVSAGFAVPPCLRATAPVCCPRIAVPACERAHAERSRAWWPAAARVSTRGHGSESLAPEGCATSLHEGCHQRGPIGLRAEDVRVFPRCIQRITCSAAQSSQSAERALKCAAATYYEDIVQ